MTNTVHTPKLRIAHIASDQVEAAADLLHRRWHACCDDRLPERIVAQRTLEHSEKHTDQRMRTRSPDWRRVGTEPVKTVPGQSHGAVVYTRRPHLEEAS